MAKNLLLKVGVKGTKKAVGGLKSVGGAITNIGVKAGIATAGLGAFSTKLAGDFQKNLLEVGTLVKGFNENQLTQMSRELRAVASASGLALGSISKAKYDIVSAGFSNAADSAAVLEASSKLAVGGVTSAAEAADLLTTSLNALGLDASDVNKVSDELFTTVRLGKTTMSELAASMGFVLPFAKSMNLDLQGVGAAMATLTASGISTAQATTSLRSAIQSLQSPSEQSKNLMKDLGIEVKRFDDGSVDLVSTIEQFRGLDPDTMRKLIPRVEGILAIQTMAQNFDTLRSNVNQFANESAGATEIAFNTMAQGFNQQMSMLRNSIHSIFIEIGNIIIEVIQPTLESVNTEFARLGEIGFDNLGKAVKDQLPEILDVLQQAFFIAIKNIESRLSLLGDRFLDAINPFTDLTDNINKRQKLLETQLSLSTSIIKDLFTNMYSDITSDAEMNALKQNEIASFLEASEIAKYEAEIERLAELIENRQELLDGEEVLEQERQERKTETLSVETLKRNQFENQSLEKTKQLIQAGVDEVEARKLHTKAMTKFDMELQASKASQVAGFFALAGQASALDKTQAKRTQLLGAAEATVMAYEAAAKTFAQFGGYPAGIVPAGLAFTIGMNNVKNILGLSFQDGGIVPGVDSGAGDTVPAMLTPGELILNQAQQENLVANSSGLTINFNGPITNEEFVKDFIIPEIENTVRGSLA